MNRTWKLNLLNKLMDLKKSKTKTMNNNYTSVGG